MLSASAIPSIVGVASLESVVVVIIEGLPGAVESNVIETEFDNKDPRQIVIDEVLGQAMPLIFIVYLSSKNLINFPVEIYYLLSFILFRFFDIVKPFPVSYFDKQHKNFFGIIMDDIMAGLYTMLIIYLISFKF